MTVYEDNGSAGYDEIGPGIRRLSVVVVISWYFDKENSKFMPT